MFLRTLRTWEQAEEHGGEQEAGGARRPHVLSQLTPLVQLALRFVVMAGMFRRRLLASAHSQVAAQEKETHCQQSGAEEITICSNFDRNHGFQLKGLTHSGERTTMYRK